MVEALLISEPVVCPKGTIHANTDTLLYSSETLLELAFVYNLPLAKQMGKMGASVYLYQLAGEPQSSGRFGR